MVIDGIEVFTTDDEGLFTSVYAYWDDADLTFLNHPRSETRNATQIEMER